MAKAKKRVQLRRCTLCNKVGHNKSTCPKQLRTSKPITNKNTVNFFVHHVVNSPVQSPHIVDLKKEKKDSSWQEIEMVAPTESTNPLYHFYHEAKQTKKTNKGLFAAPLPNAHQPLRIETDTVPLQKPTRTKKLRTNPFVWLKNKIREQNQKVSDSLAAIRQQTKNALSLRWKKIVWITVIVTVVIVAPGPTWGYYQNIKNTTGAVAANGTAGFMALQDSTIALMQSNMPEAQESITEALSHFDNAVTTLETKHKFLQSFASTLPFIGDEVTSRQKLVLAGQQLTLGNTYILKGLTESQAINSSTMAARINVIMTHLRAAIPNYENALNNLQEVDPGVLPLQYQSTFKDYRELFATIFSDVKNLALLGDSVQEIFGGKGLRRYILTFQNVDEIRATGGFMGSFAILTVKDGEILNLEVPPNGTYDLKKQLDTYLEPPKPMLLANKRWEFQDANWFPDFSASAEKILWFYQHSRQETADGVIAINSTVLERILGIIGPVKDEKRGLVLTQENAISTIQNKVETWDEEKKDYRPKQIITDLSQTFLEYFKNIKPENLLPLLVNLQESLEQKEIQLYFSDKITENAVEDYGWSGKIISTNPDQDYLLVVNTNIQGQKTDANIKQTISHQAVIDNNGTITDTVTVTRTHTGTDNGGLYGSTNIDYIRIYVPVGSELISANGFTWPDEKYFRAPDNWTKKDSFLETLEKEIGIDAESGTRITQEFNKTAFGNWIITEPGQTSQVEFTYRLANTFSNKEKTARYQLVVQRQSGSETEFESQIILPKNWSPVWKDGEKTTVASNGMIIEPMQLKTDQVWSLVAKKK